MKKLYTLALAAAVTLSASAGMFERIAKFEDATFAGELQSPVNDISMSKAPAKVDATLPKIEGDYIYTYTMDGNTWCETVTIEVNDDGTGVLKNLKFPFAAALCDDIPFTYSMEELPIYGGTFRTVPTIRIKSGTKAYTYQGADYCLYYQGLNGSLYDNDLFFFVSEGNLRWLYASSYGIGFYTQTGENSYRGNAALDPDFWFANATMTYYRYDNAAEQTEEYICKVHARQDFQYLGITGMCELGHLVVFTLDCNNKTAKAIEQTAMIYTIDGTAYDFICYGENNEPEINATFTTGDKPSVLTITDEIWRPYSESAGGYWNMYSGGEIRLPFAIEDPAGVSNIKVDNSNAPVEYFNLQGVRVQNPANGLFIRRQGNTATKVLVK